MQRKIEQLISGHARKLASPEHPLHFLLYSSNKHLLEDSKYVDLQVGKQVWFSVPRRMRQELWLSVLHKHRGAGATAAKQYATLVRQALPVDVDADIEKDVGRTFPNAARFATAAGQQSLLRVLRAYAVYDTEVGYCQGMNFLAGLLLTWMPSEATAFGGLVVLMQQRMLRDLYKSDLAKLQVYLWQFGRLLPGKLGQHMDGHGVLPVLYLSSWLLTSFGSDFPLFFSSRVLDVVLTGSYPHAVLKVAMTLLKHCGEKLLALDDMEEIVHYLKAEMPNWSREVLQDVLSDALSQAWTPAQEAVLSNEAGMETVIDAVGRVNAAAQDNAARQAEASQQAEQSQLDAAPVPTHSGLTTPPRHPLQAQQSVGSSPGAVSPLPPVPGRPAMPPARSASWSARLRALPSSPSLPVLPHSIPSQHNRRHTTNEAAHHSGLLDKQAADCAWQQTVGELAQPSAEGGDASSSTPSTQQIDQDKAQGLSGTKPGRHQTAEEAGEVYADSQAAVDVPDLRDSSATATHATDLLSFLGELDSLNSFGSQCWPQQSSGLHHEGNSSMSHPQHELIRLSSGPHTFIRSTQSQTSLAGGLQLSRPDGLRSGSDAQESEDPFQHVADISHELSLSSNQLSGMSRLGESQGSDLESWGSFLLSDESSSMMAGSTQSSQDQPAASVHTTSSASVHQDPAFAMPPPLTSNSNGNKSITEELSPNACITSKQCLQLDLFLQSSISKQE